ncbi:MAG: GNAT family N-acetyltransferase [Actinomycetota bacterium]|nr:GNAT family N-acetyltransferase [Actinomycetota bacterium]
MTSRHVMVRLATPDDGATLARLRRAWVEENAGGPADDDRFEEHFAEWLGRERHQRLTWLGLVDDLPVGMLNLLVFTRMPRPGESAPNQWGYLANFFVRETHRNTGVGARMLAACTAYADEQGFARVVLSPTERSVPFYARGGFEPATSLMLRRPPHDRG